MHLALDERFDLETARLFLSHQAKHIPVCLQGPGRTQPILAYLVDSLGENQTSNSTSVFLVVFCRELHRVLGRFAESWKRDRVNGVGDG